MRIKYNIKYYKYYLTITDILIRHGDKIGLKEQFSAIWEPQKCLVVYHSWEDLTVEVFRKKNENDVKDPMSEVLSKCSRAATWRKSPHPLCRALWAPKGNFFEIYRRRRRSRVVFTYPKLATTTVVKLQEVTLNGRTPLSGAAHNSMSRWWLPGNGDAVVLGATLFGD